MVEYVVTRIAKLNPAINGRKLYLTKLGMWSLDAANARKFVSRPDAEIWRVSDESVERVS